MPVADRQTDKHHGNSATIRGFILTNASRVNITGCGGGGGVDAFPLTAFTPSADETRKKLTIGIFKYFKR